MKHTTFYSHLIQISALEQELHDLHLNEKEKEDLMHHVHSSIHYTVLDIVISELPEEHKRKFIENTRHNNHKILWEHIKNNTVNIEEKIIQGIEKLSLEFLDEIKKLKTNT